MPRTSYGDKKRSQAWKLVVALMERQGKQGVQFYQNGAGQAYLKVEASLLDMGRWSSLSIDDVREALTQHLNKNFLGIVADQREQKAGRGAEQWKFELQLWSTNQAENQQQFDKAWKAAKFQEMPQIGQADPLLSASGDRLSTSSPSNKARFKQVQEHCSQKILSLHSRMRLLSGEEVGVDQLYVDVWLLNRSPRTFQVSEDKLLQTFDLRNDRLGLGDRIKRNPGFEIANANPKLVILGKPGAGKTTFLKHLAVDWCKGKFQPDLITVFIEFRRVQDGEWQLLDAIGKELELENWEQVEKLLNQRKDSPLEKDQEEKIEEFRQQVKTLLIQGNFLILMDGLDEVPTNELRRKVQDQLREMAEKYANNRWILTCRTQIIASIPDGFTSVEVADFSSEQVHQFVQNWFRASGHSDVEAAQQWERFKNAVAKNPALKELTVTPVLLSLMCLVFHDEGEMPSQMTDLYKRGIRLLLEKWNDAKAIEGWEVGSEIYRRLSVEQKEALLIGIAARKFENPKNFVLFEQAEVAAQIAQFLQLANSREGVAVLKAMEAQHGLLIERADELWSFSHLTFQEYFTVQWLTQLPPEQLAEKTASQQWQAVVKQLVNSQQPADRLLRLIKQAIDRSIANESKISQFMLWMLQKAESVQSTNKPAAIRAFYFALDRARTFAVDLDLDLDLARALDRTFAVDHDRTFAVDHDLAHPLALALALDRALACVDAHDLALAHAHDLARAYDRAHDRARAHDRTRARALVRDHDLARARALALALAPDLEKTSWSDPKLKVKLRAVYRTLPDFAGNSGEGIRWWQTHGNQWVEQLRQVMIEHRNIGHDWQFTEAQKQQLHRYYEASKFLVELMNIRGAVTNSVRAEIEDTLLLPWDELQRRQPDVYGQLQSASPSPVRVFIAYSHKDDDLRGELDSHLANLKRQGKIQAWYRGAIEAGAEWDAAIKQQLETAQIILLLISAAFIASDHCYDLLQQSLQRHDARTARVIPIILKPTDWQGSPFSHLSSLPTNGVPITSWSNPDGAFLNVVEGIRGAIESIGR